MVQELSDIKSGSAGKPFRGACFARADAAGRETGRENQVYCLQADRYQASCVRDWPLAQV